MPNYYTQVTADQALKCTADNYARLKGLLDEADDSEEGPHGFSSEYDGGQLYLYADEVGSWGALSDSFLAALGALIAANGLPHLEFGASFSASRLCAGACGGTYFRILPDGSLIEPTLVWPSA